MVKWYDNWYKAENFILKDLESKMISALVTELPSKNLDDCSHLNTNETSFRVIRRKGRVPPGTPKVKKGCSMERVQNAEN